MRRIGLLFVLALVAGCGHKSSTAPTAGGVHLEVQIAPSLAGPAAPAQITATASNDGAGRYRGDGCPSVNGLYLELRDPTDNQVYLSNPLYQPLCPQTTAAFERGRRVEAQWTFDGDLYDGSGQAMQATTGDCTAIVRFTTYSNAQLADPQTNEQMATIHWVVP